MSNESASQSTVIKVDLAKSSSMSSETRESVLHELFERIENSISSIYNEETLSSEHEGDGRTFIIHSINGDMHVKLVTVVLENVRIGLNRLTKKYNLEPRLQMRISITIGNIYKNRSFNEVHKEAERLLNSEDLKQILADNSELPLVCSVSEDFYKSIKDVEPGLEDDFSLYSLKTKDGTIRAYICPPRSVPKVLIPSQSYKTTLEDYKADILEGRFTPIIGPLCNSIARNNTNVISHVSDRYGCLVKEIATSDDTNRPDTQRYIDSLVVSELGSLDFLDRDPQTNQPDGIIKLQHAIATLGAWLTNIYGRLLLSNAPCFTDIKAPRAEIPHGDEREFISLLISVCRTAAALRIKCPCDYGCECPNMGKGLIKKVIHLGELLVPHLYVKYERVSGDIAQFIEENRIDIDAAMENCTAFSKGGICAGHLEWIGHLMRYTFYYDSPRLCTAEDLAFQLSLCADEAPPFTVRPEAVAAAARDPERCMRGVLKQSSMRAHVSDRARDFYCKIVRLVPHAPASTGSNIRIVATTNYDLELETAFEDNNRDYTVMLPVIKRGSVDDMFHSPGNRSWLILHRKQIAPGAYSNEWQLCPDRDGGKDNTKLKDWLQRKGPLVMKLRGSPLHDLPSYNKDDVRADLLSEGAKRMAENDHWEFKHRVILTDYDFFDRLWKQELWPECAAPFVEQHDRTLCFLGFQLDNAWGALDVGGNVFYRERSQANRSGVYVDHPKTPFRRSLLNQYNLVCLNLALENIAAGIDRLAWLTTDDTHSEDRK